MIDTTLELQYELTQLQREREREADEANKKEENKYLQYKARIANRNKDIDILLREGSNPYQVSEILGVNPTIVKSRLAAIEREEAEKREFLALGPLSFGEGGYIGILQS
jgi:hypothetical protein